MKTLRLRQRILSLVIATVAAGGVMTCSGPAKAVTADEALGLANMTRLNTQKISIQQAIIVLGSESSDIDGDGYMEPPAMLTGVGAPAGGGFVPASSAAPKTDSYGSKLGYCAYDNGSTSTSTGRITGTASGYTAPVLAVIAAGADNVFQTTCANVAAGVGAQGDDYLISYNSTQIQMGNSGTLFHGDPVATMVALNALAPASLQDGQIRLVKSTNALYKWNAGTSAWVAVGAGAGGSTDGSAQNLAPFGSLAAPGYAFLGATDTGMFMPSVNRLGLSIGGTSAMMISTPTRNIGLGQANYPNYAGGTNNIAIGYGSYGGPLSAITSGSNNAAFGNSLQRVTTGSYNVGFGNAGYGITNGDNNFAAGNEAMLYANGSGNFAVGSGSMRNSGGSGNIAIGQNTLTAVSNGQNIAFGQDASRNVTSGYGNIALGIGSNTNTTTGSHNTALGYFALSGNSTGQFHVAMGPNAGAMTNNRLTATENTYIGSGARLEDTAAMAGSGSITLIGANTRASALTAATANAYMTALGAGSTVSSTNTLVLGRASTYTSGLPSGDRTVIGAATASGSSAILQVNGASQLVGMASAPVGAPGLMYFNSALQQFQFHDGTTWTGLGGLPPALSAITAAQAGNTLNNGAFAQTWNWQLSGNTTAMAFGESVASTGGTGAQNLVAIRTLAGSTAVPLLVSSQGNEVFRVSASSTPQILAATSNSTFSPTYSFAVNSQVGMGVTAGGELHFRSGQRIYAFTGNNIAMNIDNYTDSGSTSVGSYSQSGVGGTNLGSGNMFRLTTGADNIAVGRGVGTFLTTGTANIGIGIQALNLATANSSYNVAVGRSALSSATSNYNVAVGDQAGQASGSGYSTFIGTNAGIATTSQMQGSGYITLLGANAQASGLAAANANAYMTAIGAGANVTSVNTVVLGRATDTTVIGATATNASGNRLQVTGGIQAVTGNIVNSAGQFLGANGGVAAPTFAFSASPSTGFWAPYDGTIAASVAGQGAFFLTPSNTAVGYAALLSSNQSHQNVAVGPYAMNLMNGGTNNAAVGADALRNAVSASYSVALGNQAGMTTTNALTTQYNTFIGARASIADNATSAGSGYITLLGANSTANLPSATAAAYATAVGAGSLVTTPNTVVLGRATDKVVIGATGANASAALLQVNGMSQHVGLASAPSGAEGGLYYNSTTKQYEFHNGTIWKSFIGSGPVSQLTAATANNTIANGAFAQAWNWQLTGNTTAMAFSESAASTGGTGNAQVLVGIKTLSGSTAIPLSVSAQGSEIFRVSPSSFNPQILAATSGSTLLPTYAFNADIQSGMGLTSTGQMYLRGQNGMMGYVGNNLALVVELAGGGGTALGANIRAGSGGTALGSDTLFRITTGVNNVAIGREVGQFITTGSHNTAVGRQAMVQTIGAVSNNVAVGRLALAYTGSDFNTAVGDAAGAQSGSGYSTFIGAGSSGANTPSMQGSGYITLLGANTVASGLAAATPNAYMSAIGAGASVTSINTVVLGRTTDNVVIGQTMNGPQQFYVNGTAGGTSGYAVSSDARFKMNVVPLSAAMDRIQKIQGVSYEFNHGAFPNRTFEGGRQLGFIAQQIEPIVPEVVRTDRDGFKSVQYSQLVPLLVEGMKEQQSVLKHLVKKNDVTLALNIATLEGDRAHFKRVEAEILRAKHMEAETARVNLLHAQEVETIKLKSQTVESTLVRSDVFKTGQTEAFVTFGAFQPMFAPAADTQYIVNASSEDGSAAIASVAMMAGRIVVTPITSKGIDVVALGTQVGFTAPNKKVKATWIRMS